MQKSSKLLDTHMQDKTWSWSFWRWACQGQAVIYSIRQVGPEGLWSPAVLGGGKSLCSHRVLNPHGLSHRNMLAHLQMRRARCVSSLFPKAHGSSLPLGLQAPAGLSSGSPTKKGNVLLFLELRPEGRATA